jgi:hypothetical protein
LTDDHGRPYEVPPPFLLLLGRIVAIVVVLISRRGREQPPEKAGRWPFWFGPDELSSIVALTKSVRDG